MKGQGIWVVVISSNGVVCGVTGPFASAETAQAYVDKRNETQAGQIVGEVHEVKR